MVKTINKKKGESKMLINNEVKALGKIADSKAARYILRGIHHNTKRNVWEATDGMIYLSIPTKHSDYDFDTCKEFYPKFLLANKLILGDVNIPAKELADFLKGMKKSSIKLLGEKALIVTADEGKEINVFSTDMKEERRLNIKSIDGPYPNTELIQPEYKRPIKTKLGIHLLEKMIKAAKDLKSGSVEFTIESEEKNNSKALKFELKNENNEVDASGILMPIKIKE